MSKVKVKIYVQNGDINDTRECTLEKLETLLNEIWINENSMYGIQVLFDEESTDVYKMDYEQFQNFVYNVGLQEYLICILVGYKAMGNKEDVNDIINYDDIVWLFKVDDFSIPSAYDEYSRLGNELISYHPLITENQATTEKVKPIYFNVIN